MPVYEANLVSRGVVDEDGLDRLEIAGDLLPGIIRNSMAFIEYDSRDVSEVALLVREYIKHVYVSHSARVAELEPFSRLTGNGAPDEVVLRSTSKYLVRTSAVGGKGGTAC